MQQCESSHSRQSPPQLLKHALTWYEFIFQLSANEINPNLYHYIEKFCPCIENLRLSCVPIYVRSFETLEDKAVKGSFHIYVNIIAQMLWTTHSTGSARAGETC